MPSSKHIANKPKDLVKEALSGLVYLNPDLSLTGTTVALSKPNKANVSLLCGGGAGHEPAHAAFVGEGMLTAAVSGQVFASPNAHQVEEALKKLSFTTGTLIIVKNYTGDVLHFGLAKERWSATHLGEDKVRLLVVGDDVSVPRSQGKLTGRRGLAATTIVYKVAGALAAKGHSLDEVEHLAKLVAERSGTMGVGLDHCHVPGTEASDESYLGKDEIEIGMGIHNEPGIRKASPIPSTERVVDELLSAITGTEDKERSFVDFKNDGKDEVILMVNNLGAMPELELAGIVNEAAKWLQRKHITVQRAIAGSFMTSLSLPGFSLSLVLLPREPVATPSSFSSKLSFDKDLILECFDAPTEAPGWRWSYKGKPVDVKEEAEEKVHKDETEREDVSVKGPAPTDSKLFIAAIKTALKLIIAAEPEITRYDTIAGDGDAGLTLKAGAEGVEAKLASLSRDDVVKAMVQIGEVTEEQMGGTSGGLYSIFFSALAKGLLDAAKEKKEEKATAEVWSRGLELALNTLYKYSLARPPSRTLIDPLASFILTFQNDPSDFNAAFQAASDAAEATRNVEATAGRAAYVDKSKLEEANVPDAGAWGVLKALSGIKEALDGSE